MVKRLALRVGETLLASVCLVVAVELWHIGEIALAVRNEKKRPTASRKTI